MTWNPILPPAILVVVVLAMLAVCVLALVRAGGPRRRRDWVFRIAAVVLLGLACFRPGIGSQGAPAAASDVDVFFVVDTTASMNAEDWGSEPRLAGVRADVAALAEAHAGARFSLVTFDSDPQLRLPLTTDASALQSSMSTLRPEITTYSSGSSISIANEYLAALLERTAEASPERARVVYYLGDGEQTVDTAPESFADSAGLFQGGAVLGYGTETGGPMRETLGGFDTTEPGYIQDPSGGDAVSRIDEVNLQAVASQLGVAYQHRTPDAPVEPAAVDASTVMVSGGDVERSFDLYWILAIAVFALFLREVWIVTRTLVELAGARGRTT